MVDLSRLVARVKGLVRDNPDAVRGGLDKVESTLNRRTGGKYADKLAEGRRGLDGALGVPRDATQAYREGQRTESHRPDPVETDPIDPPAPVDRPRDL